MEFVIDKEIIEEIKYRNRNKYKLEIETLKLNNDSSENVEFITIGYYSPKEMDYLRELIYILEEIKLYIKKLESTTDCTYIDNFNYENINNFNKWFNRSYLTREEIKKLPSKIKEQKWMWDSIYQNYEDVDCGYSYLLDYKLTYINKEGRNYKVKITSN